jgi:arylsulfatase A-like enzyme
MIATLLLALVLGQGTPAPAPAPEPERPNLVLAIADDLDPGHLGFEGNPRARTPRLDQLAAEGVRIPVLWAQPVCRPALATLLTGRWPHETGILSNTAREQLAPAGALPGLLKAQGYATFCGGKFWEENLAAFGFDAPEDNDDRFGREGEEGGQAAVYRFLEQHAATGPWFVWWAPSLPHTPHRPPVRFAEDFAETEVPVPEAFTGDPAEFVEAERASLAMHAWLDADLKHLLDKLAELGELANTVVVFVADNGWSTWRPAKGTPYELGVRSPLLLSAPGATQHGTLPEVLADLVDVHATVLDYAGVALPEGCRGQSLRPLLEGRPFQGRERLFGAAYPRKVRQPAERELYALYARDARWKYVRFVRDVNSQEFSPGARLAPLLRKKGGKEELYDLQQDPFEQHDLAHAEEHAVRLAEFRTATLAWWRANGGAEIPGWR